MTKDITVNGVDLRLLNEQRIELHFLLRKQDQEAYGDSILWGLLEMLDYICDQYDTEIYTEERCERGCGFALVAIDGEEAAVCGICAEERGVRPETSLAVLDNAWPDGFTCDDCQEVVHYHGQPTDQ